MSYSAKLGSQDEAHMREVIALAAEAAGNAWPSPMGACLIVGPSGRAGSAVTNGTANPCLTALQQASAVTNGASAYVLQEACVFSLPPDASAEFVVQAFAAAGIRRMVAGPEHPDPTLAGKGFAALRAAGLEVVSDALAPSVSNLTRAYRKWCRTGLPYVTVLTTGESATRSSAVHKEAHVAEEYRSLARHAHDAVLIDFADLQPQSADLFQDRSGLPRNRKLIRLVHDPELHLDPNSAIVASWDNDLLLLTEEGDADRVDAIRGVGIGVETLASSSPSPWQSVLFTVAQLPVYSVLVESQGAVVSALLRQSLVDEVIVLSDGAPPTAPAWLTTQPVRTAQLALGSSMVATSYLLTPAVL